MFLHAVQRTRNPIHLLLREADRCLLISRPYWADCFKLLTGQLTTRKKAWLDRAPLGLRTVIGKFPALAIRLAGTITSI
jgi:hypothetical protein